MQNTNQKSVVCFGEVLWDVLPSGKLAGGAPMNVAYHLNGFGLNSRMISRVGADALGAELRQFLEGKGVATDLVQTDLQHSTGTVQVELDEKGSPSYDIVRPVAWDFIQSENNAIEAVAQAELFVFGSLASRMEMTHSTLFSLLSKARKIVLDVNLRAPYFSKELLEPMLDAAHIVKVNDEELELIASWYGFEGTSEELMDKLYRRFDLEVLIQTRGKDGAICQSSSGMVDRPGVSVQVEDTIGSGDSFLAAFLSKMLEGEPMESCLDFACHVGALVATKKGGTPSLSSEELDAFIQSNKNS
ncbi:MAG: carbohydrate kinase [Saprospiraceae bacterium]